MDGDNKHQTPNTKHQTPNTKHQTPSSKLQKQFTGKKIRNPKFSAWLLIRYATFGYSRIVSDRTVNARCRFEI
ncbi:MAG: hypothetical protein C5B50_26235 [Verrucomicrobia bacterium]|nr:MAG: hypothetical protein C5B50_26235 [Verrucomicrobiota bacterium]